MIHVCVPAFGDCAEAVTMWLDFFVRSGSGDHATVCFLTKAGQDDDIRSLQAVAQRDQVVCTVVPLYLETLAPLLKNNLAIAGMMKAMAMTSGNYSQDAIVACDLDLVFLDSIEPLCSLEPGYHMCKDPATRTHREIPECGVEMNSGLMVRSGLPPSDTFYSEYVRLILKYQDTNAAKTIPYFDEIIATAVWRNMGGKELCSTWNHSHTYTQKPTRTFHGHGKLGKQRLKELHRKHFGVES